MTSVCPSMKSHRWCQIMVDIGQWWNPEATLLVLKNQRHYWRILENSLAKANLSSQVPNCDCSMSSLVEAHIEVVTILIKRSVKRNIVWRFWIFESFMLERQWRVLCMRVSKMMNNITAGRVNKDEAMYANYIRYLFWPFASICEIQKRAKNN